MVGKYALFLAVGLHFLVDWTSGQSRSTVPTTRMVTDVPQGQAVKGMNSGQNSTDDDEGIPDTGSNTPVELGKNGTVSKPMFGTKSGDNSGTNATTTQRLAVTATPRTLPMPSTNGSASQNVSMLPKEANGGNGSKLNIISNTTVQLAQNGTVLKQSSSDKVAVLDTNVSNAATTKNGLNKTQPIAPSPSKANVFSNGSNDDSGELDDISMQNTTKAPPSRNATAPTSTTGPLKATTTAKLMVQGNLVARLNTTEVNVSKTEGKNGLKNASGELDDIFTQNTTRKATGTSTGVPLKATTSAAKISGQATLAASLNISEVKKTQPIAPSASGFNMSNNGSNDDSGELDQISMQNTTAKLPSQNSAVLTSTGPSKTATAKNLVQGTLVARLNTTEVDVSKTEGKNGSKDDTGELDPISMQNSTRKIPSQNSPVPTSTRSPSMVATTKPMAQGTLVARLNTTLINVSKTEGKNGSKDDSGELDDISMQSTTRKPLFQNSSFPTSTGGPLKTTAAKPMVQGTLVARLNTTDINVSKAVGKNGSADDSGELDDIFMQNNTGKPLAQNSTVPTSTRSPSMATTAKMMAQGTLVARLNTTEVDVSKTDGKNGSKADSGNTTSKLPSQNSTFPTNTRSPLTATTPKIMAQGTLMARLNTTEVNVPKTEGKNGSKDNAGELDRISLQNTTRKQTSQNDTLPTSTPGPLKTTATAKSVVQGTLFVGPLNTTDVNVSKTDAKNGSKDDSDTSKKLPTQISAVGGPPKATTAKILAQGTLVARLNTTEASVSKTEGKNGSKDDNGELDRVFMQNTSFRISTGIPMTGTAAKPMAQGSLVARLNTTEVNISKTDGKNGSKVDVEDLDHIFMQNTTRKPQNSAEPTSTRSLSMVATTKPMALGNLVARLNTTEVNVSKTEGKNDTVKSVHISGTFQMNQNGSQNSSTTQSKGTVNQSQSVARFLNSGILDENSNSTIPRAAAASGNSNICGLNEVLLSCAKPPPCQPKCSDRNGVPTTTIRCPKNWCWWGCQCKDGFFRDSSWKCVSAENCR